MAKNFWQKFKKPILALAPMAGVTDSAFRQICKEYGADVLYTEMISADALHYDSKKTLAMLDFTKAERPVVCQLFGKRPEMYARAAQLVTKAGYSGLDINFGCPAKKVVAHGGGVTLMRDLSLCRQIIETVLANTNLPVSVKIRSSINKLPVVSRQLTAVGQQSVVEKITALDFLQAVKDLPISAVMVHGRSYEQPFSGQPDYAMIKAVKENFSGIVLGNGGIFTPAAAKEMLEKTGVDGLGLARGLYGRPWLFKQIKEYLKKDRYSEFTFAQIKKAMLLHAKLAYRSSGDHGLMELRKHLAWYVKGLPGAAELRQQLVVVKSLAEIKDILRKY